MPSDTGFDRFSNAVITSTHPFLDFITGQTHVQKFMFQPSFLVGADTGGTAGTENRRQTREELQAFGIPLSKVGFEDEDECD